MSLFIGAKKGKIRIVSDKIFSNPELEIIELLDFPDDSISELIINYKVVNGKIIKKFQKKAAKDLKIALISNWKMECGIATYAEKIWREVVPHVKSFRLFVEENDLPTGQLNVIRDLEIPAEDVVPCWKRGESLQLLTAKLKEYDPDIIWIQHEFGLWPNARYWLAMLTQLYEYRVIATMHSVFHHQDKTICEAHIPEIVVHLEGAKKVLKDEKHIPGEVYVIPHGCDPCIDKTKLWNLYRSKHTFLQFGFGLRYKGWENSIRAVAILKEKYPDIFFTALFSESKGNKVEHHIYYSELMDLIKELGLEENVALIKSYQSDESLNSYIRTNQVSVFPYISKPEHEVFGVSGAARLAMSKGVPVITSSVNHFSDLPTIKADGPERIAEELDKLFMDWKLKQKQINIQLDYIKENSWENIALQYIKLFES